MAKKYRICNRCIMDISDPDIIFDENGICNHCKGFFEDEKKIVFKGEDGRRKLINIFNKIKAEGKNKQYDCILGVSGGTDSSYVAYLAYMNNLKVLLVHIDNGYNTETAENNIKNIAKKTNYDLHRIEANFEEFKDLQLSYLKASVVDIEAISDYAIKAGLYSLASENGIKYVLNGRSFVTEKIMPKSWNYIKIDLKNITSIHKKYGAKKLEKFPRMGLLKLLYYVVFKGITEVSPLNYINYNKKEAKKLLHKEFDWEDYGIKHGESIITKFYQNYILPMKFNIDKRKAHLSNLICSGQITRDEAINELKKPIYDDEDFIKDKEYVLDKLNLSETDFNEIMALPIKQHQEFGSNEWIYSMLLKFKK